MKFSTQVLPFIFTHILENIYLPKNPVINENSDFHNNRMIYRIINTEYM